MRQDKASYTAAKVALNVVALAKHPEIKNILPQDLGPAVAQLLIAAKAYPKWIVETAQKGNLLGLSNLIGKGMRLTLGARIADTYFTLAYRKIFVERQVRTAIEQGAQQVLILGGGYDTLCWRLAPQFPEVLFLEIDHPATGRAKASALQKLGKATNFLILQADLSQTDLKEALASLPEWHNAVCSVIAAEGLLMYLHAGDIRKLLKSAALCSGPNSRFVFDHLYKRKGKPDIGALTDITLLSLKLMGEPFLWSIQPTELHDFVVQTDWHYRPDLVGEPEAWGLEAFATLSKSEFNHAVTN